MLSRLKQAVLDWYCRRFGHNCEVEDFVSAEYDHNGRMTDIHGGGCDWHCKRCGAGGRNWW